MKSLDLRSYTWLFLLAAAVAVSCVPAHGDAPAGTTATDPAVDQAPPTPNVRYIAPLFPDVTVDRDLQYGIAPDLEHEHPMALSLDLYRPAVDSAARRPVFIWVHGGGFANGDKANDRDAMMATQFAQRGYVAVSINYRLLDGPGCSADRGIGPRCFNAGVEAVHDAQAAVRWLRANADEYGIDVDRIAVAGESAGAIVAVGVGVASDFPGEGNNPEYPSKVRAWVSISGGLPDGIFVDSTDSPGLLFAGTKDKIVPYEWSVETANAMREAGVTAVLERLEGAGHTPWEEYGELFQGVSRDFLYTQLDLDGAEH
jgi:acetyl esterase/lipase